MGKEAGTKSFRQIPSLVLDVCSHALASNVWSLLASVHFALGKKQHEHTSTKKGNCKEADNLKSWSGSLKTEETIL